MGSPNDYKDGEVRVVVATKIKCPLCFHSTLQKCYGRDGATRYYKCGHCVPTDKTGDSTKYKVIYDNE